MLFNRPSTVAGSTGSDPRDFGAITGGGASCEADVPPDGATTPSPPRLSGFFPEGPPDEAGPPPAITKCPGGGLEGLRGRLSTDCPGPQEASAVPARFKGLRFKGFKGFKAF